MLPLAINSLMVRLAQASLGAPGSPCTPSGGGFFDFPTWYQYLPGEVDYIDTSKCVPTINPNIGFQSFLAIGLAVIDILLYLGGIVAVVFVIYGGFLYMTSQGEPDKTAAAKNTIMNAIIGLIIVLFSIIIVGWVGRLFPV